MKWFEGGIPQAIQAAKNNQSVFIVFITGEDEASSQMESYLHSEEVTGLCETNRCVAVKLASNSDDCKFFSQIFPVVVIPSTFFIGDNGTPLEVIGECKSPADFLEKVKAAINLQNQSSQNKSSQPPTASGSGQQQQNASKKRSSEEVQEAETVAAESQSVQEGAVGGASDGNGDEATPEKQSKTEDLKLDDKVERAKELIRLKQEEKARKESEEAKSKERERRNMGQGIQKLRETQKEMEVLEAKKEFRKDKEDDKLARQRVKEQIARDRAEKNARFSEAKAERDRAAEEAKRQKLMEQQASAQADMARRSEIARIQFRLPDGSSLVHQFPATDTFASIHQFISGHMGCSVTLSTTFPKRTFTQADHGATLQELALAPSAVILVLPGSGKSQAVSSGGGGLTVTSLLFSPFWFVWNIIASLFGISSNSSSSSSSSSSQQQQSPSPSSTSATGGDRNPGGARQRDSSSRQQGSIRRFHNSDDDVDDEDRATWNGNSTQQM